MVTEQMIDAGVKAMSGWGVWEIKNPRMYEQERDFIREILEASLQAGPVRVEIDD